MVQLSSLPERSRIANWRALWAANQSDLSLRRRGTIFRFPSISVARPSIFRFLDPGPLSDGEFELVVPQKRWVDDLLAACRHPMTVRDSPDDARITRDQAEHFLKSAPFGHDPGDLPNGRMPAYHFWMMLRHGPASPHQPPPIRIAGDIGLRIGSTEAIDKYYGNFGYHVYPPARGQAYALRACRLLLPLARRHGIRGIWITCNPENTASRRTCEKLGAKLIETIPVPPTEPLYERGDRNKCRYWLEL